MGMLDGKVAILTGSGRGIGSAAARMFAAEGALVVVSDLDPNPAEETAGAIRAAGGKAIVVAGDVTDPAFPVQLIKATLDAYGGIDIIVNNAGYTWDGVIQNMTDKQWYAMIDVHTTAPFRILREASNFIRDAARKEQAAHGRANPRKVINVSSVSGVYGNAGKLLNGESRYHRPDQNAGKGMGPLQRPGQLRLLRLHRNTPDSGQRECREGGTRR